MKGENNIKVDSSSSTGGIGEEAGTWEIELKNEISSKSQHIWISQKQEVVVFLHDGKIRAFSSICPHMGAALEYNVQREKLFCPWHGLEFDLNSLTSNHRVYRNCKEYSVQTTNDPRKIILRSK